MIDLLVAGGGPVGLVTAINAALAGLEVTIIDPHSGTIDKACGEGLMPKALEHLARIGVHPTGVDFRGIRYIAGERVAEAYFSQGLGRGVRRTTLHDSLRQRAMELHINFVEGRVESLAQSDASVKAAGIESRYLIGADGLHSTVRHQLRMEIPNQKKIGNRYGIRQHFNVPPWSDLVEVYWLSDVEVYVTPVDPQTVGIAVLGKSTLNFKSIVERIPQLVEHLAAAEPSSKLRGAGPLRQRVRSQSVGRVLLVGDASGYIDALTGEGLRVGFAEAEAAVRAVCKDNPDAYRAEWKRVTRSYRWLTGGLLFAGSNRIIRPMIVPAAQALPRIYRRLIDTLA